MITSLPRSGMLFRTVGDVLSRFQGKTVKVNGASDYHDQYGHVLCPMHLLSSLDGFPATLSPKNLYTEKVAEVVQRMLMRVSDKKTFSSLDQANLHAEGTLSRSQLDRVSRQLDALGLMPLKIAKPDPQGRKLTKEEALTWVLLYALEDVHILADHVTSGVCCPTRRSATKALEDFKVKIAVEMYRLAHTMKLPENGDKMLAEARDFAYAQTGVAAPFAFLTLKQLGQFYDTFYPRITELDSYVARTTGKTLSTMTVDEIDLLPLSALPPKSKDDISLRLVHRMACNNEPSTGEWQAFSYLDLRRGIRYITHIVPPQSSRDLL